MLKYLQDSKEQTGNEIKKVAIFTDKAAIGQELIRCVNLFAPITVWMLWPKWTTAPTLPTCPLRSWL